VYEDTPAGEVRRGIASGSFLIKGDAGRSVDAMIATMDAEQQPPLRLALGSTAYASISTDWPSGLRALETQRMSRSRQTPRRTFTVPQRAADEAGGGMRDEVVMVRSPFRLRMGR
jgi:hypothetical protein